MVEDCGTAMRYLTYRAEGSEATFWSADAGAAAGPHVLFVSPGAAFRASPTSRPTCTAAISSPAVMFDALTAGIPSRRIAACTTQRISTSTAGIRSIEIAPAQLGM